VYLERGIHGLLKGNDALVSALCNHPFIAGLFRGTYNTATVKDRGPLSKTNLPTYIPAASFALALLDMAAKGRDLSKNAKADSPRTTIFNVRTGVGNIAQPEAQRVLLSALDRANGDIAQAQVHNEAWFNGAMDRVCGWYSFSPSRPAPGPSPWCCFLCMMIESSFSWCWCASARAARLRSIRSGSPLTSR
jgi:hypothetical protein